MREALMDYSAHGGVDILLFVSGFVTGSIGFIGVVALIRVIRLAWTHASNGSWWSRKSRMGIIAAICLSLSTSGLIIAMDKQNDRLAEQNHVETLLVHDIKDKYKVSQVNVGSGYLDKMDVMMRLARNDQENRPHLSVMLESGDTVTYEVGFDEKSEMTLYLPVGTDLPAPESIERG